VKLGLFRSNIYFYLDKLSQLEKIKCFTDIDGKITEAEISSAIKEMKSNKSTGLDNISNEMLKSGQSFLIPCLHKHVVRCPRFFCKPHLAIIDHMVFI
jgi:hypothetical protein